MTINLAAKSPLTLDCTHVYIPYEDTGFYSPLVLDYLQKKNNVEGLYEYTPDAEGLSQAIENRAKYPVNRQVLVDTLKKQYEYTTTDGMVVNNINALADENTFTICTAHQPNLLTGYLYFIYKIVHVIKLADTLNKQYPDKHFVPVYYMGSEDNDLDELGTFKYNRQKFTWNADGQTGAVGRMSTKNLEKVLNELFRVLGPPGDSTEQLKELLTTAYLEHQDINHATHYLVNALFGRYGLVVLNPDEAAFKREMLHILKDDLLNHKAGSIVAEQDKKLEKYKTQAYPRDINLFYLHDQLRERIEVNGDKWQVLNTDIEWTEKELFKELEAHPERFSPNVILRGILQESILPDVAFVGGGAEVAYWLQLKRLFEHYNIFYPAILLRQSVQWIESKDAALKSKLGLNTKQLFTPTEQLKKEYIERVTNGEWETKAEREAIEKVFSRLKEKASSLDRTLEPSAEAVLTKMNKQLEVLEKKMLRAEKKKNETILNRIEKLKNNLFPNSSLQERYENFIQYYPLYGSDFIDAVYNYIEPLRNEFLVITAAE